MKHGFVGGRYERREPSFAYEVVMDWVSRYPVASETRSAAESKVDGSEKETTKS